MSGWSATPSTFWILVTASLPVFVLGLLILGGGLIDLGLIIVEVLWPGALPPVFGETTCVPPDDELPPPPMVPTCETM